MTKESLIKDLIQGGLKKNDKVLLHTSLKQIGEVDANVVLDAIMEYFNQGLVLMPTHTWDIVRNDDDVFDVINSKPNTGILPTLFMQRPNVYRSLHPTHSLAAFGNGAKDYILGEELLTTPCTPQGVYGRLYAIDAKILLVGVNHSKNTYIHSIEESFGVTNRLNPQLNYFKVIDYNRKTLTVAMHRHYCSLHPHVSECYQKLDPIFLELGVEYKTKFGNATMIVVSAQKAFQVLAKIFAKEKQILVEKEYIPTEYYRY